MKTFTEKQNQSDQTSHANLTRRNTQASEASHEVHPLLNLQRTNGNQAVLQLLRANGKIDEGSVIKTDEPSPRALMLLEVFTKNKQSFRRFSSSEFQRESNDKDATVETIKVKKGNTNWTCQFITNKNTAYMYVRESQDGTEIANYYQGSVSEKTSPETVPPTTPITNEKSTTNVGDKPAHDKTKMSSGSSDKDASNTSSPDNEKKDEDKPAKKKDRKIGETIIPGGIYVGVFDQTWLPGNTFRGVPCHQGDLGPELEQALINFAGRIKNNASFPRELKVCVTLFNDTGGPAPGFKYAAENAGSNIKKFLEARLPKSIKVTETHKVVDPGKSPNAGTKFFATVTPVY